MNCRHCETELDEAAKFCSECGRKVIAGTPASRREALAKHARSVLDEGRVAAGDGIELAKEGIKTPTGKSVAACAAIGAAAGAAIPLVGTVTGAGIGAFIGLVRKL
ncbi:zinc ribbon domain-containing protein [Erythrobacter sp. HKB08]|uniref:zinc ribbon domain-containing protein n=1 Tax=Erythrobacter sp. HKB08 TaxID=2502843 RepID=UPI0010089368